MRDASLDSPIERRESTAATQTPAATPHRQRRRQEEPQPDAFLPTAPSSLEEAGLTATDAEAIALRFLLSTGQASGRHIAEQLRLPFLLINGLLATLKDKLLIAYCGSAPMSDYEYELTDAGGERAERHAERCSYFGAAPVSLEQYQESVRKQSLRRTQLRITSLCHAFEDLHLPPSTISQIGQALQGGRGLFIYGDSGNGKTSIAERITNAVSQHIWIPRSISFGGEIMRLFDPGNHQEAPLDEDDPALEGKRIDRRWVRIRRPRIMVGGELTMEQLEVRHNPATGIIEAPLQLKSNGGALVIDDFGRQRVPSAELLNRWIVPLEKGFDFLTLPSGRQLQTPFELLLVVATNLEPHCVADEAFLRRIPYKIEVASPSSDDFRMLLRRLAKEMEVGYDDDAVDYLLKKHYRDAGRPIRYCHAEELIRQVKTLCLFQDRRPELTAKAFDIAVMNYFAGL